MRARSAQPRGQPLRSCRTYDRDAAKCGISHVGSTPCRYTQGMCRATTNASTPKLPHDSHAVPAVLLAAHFITQPNPHTGGFALAGSILAGRRRPLEDNVDNFLASSPAVVNALKNGSLVMYVVHDTPGRFTSRYRNVMLLRLTPDDLAIPRIPANDGRWSAFDHVLRTQPIPPSSCVFAIDWPDVKLASGQLHRACATNPRAIFAASDICDARGVKRWMRGTCSEDMQKG